MPRSKVVPKRKLVPRCHLNVTNILAEAGIPSDAAVEEVAGSYDPQIFNIAHESGLVLRVYCANDEQACEREMAALADLEGTAVPAPAVVSHAVAQGSRPYLLESYLSGEPLMAKIMHDLDSAMTASVEFGRMQRRIHAITASPRVPAHVWRKGIPRWLPELIDVLDEAVRDERTLLHLNYRPANVLVDGDDVSGVLNWSHVAAGDVRFDIAMTVAFFRAAPLPEPFLCMLADNAELNERTLRSAIEAGWVLGYHFLRGRGL